MKVQLIQVPYDSGHEGQRTGRGPDHFMQRGLDQILRDGGCEVDSYRIVSKSAWKADIETTFELDRLLAEQVSLVIASGKFPVVLAGACNSCVGTLAGLGEDPVGMVWFDAHGDFNTPETTTSGMLDGMGLAMAAGRCWRALLRSVPGFHPVPEANIIHMGGYDFDPEEGVQLRQSDVKLIELSPDLDAIRDALGDALTELSNSVKRVYIHMDLDVLDTGEAMANHAASPGGLSVKFVEDAIAMIKAQFDVCAGAIGSVDPEYDRDDQVLEAGIAVTKAIVA
jgi:arginase